MNDFLLKQYNDLTGELKEILVEIESLPKGYVRCREIAGKYYYYLQFRDGKTVRSKYLSEEERRSVEPAISRRKELLGRKRELQRNIGILAQNLGIHHYRPVKTVDYSEYTLFMSHVAHEFKRLGKIRFLSEVDTKKYRGIKKRYLRGFVDYLSGDVQTDFRRSDDLVLDPYTYQMYFEYGQKDVLEEELKKAIPAFLNQGLLITNVQEAVR